MKSLMPSLLSVATLFSQVRTQQDPITQPVLGVDPYVGLNIPQTTYGASVLALLYGAPLYVYGLTLQNGGFAQYAGNKFIPGNGLSNPNTPGRLENVDTVYGQGVLDLAAQDLVLTIPPMQSDRYYSFSLFDPYSTDYIVLGSVNGNPAGDYLIRPSIKTGKVRVTTQNCDGYVGCIDYPTLNIFFIVRVAAIPKNKTDISYVVKYLHSIKVQETNHHSPLAPALQQSDFDGLSANNITFCLQLLARFADRNPPADTLYATFLPFTLLAAGISNGTYNQPSSVDLDQVSQAWNDITAAFLASPANTIQLGNGWTVAAPAWSGDFQQGTNLVARAQTGRRGYAQNTAKESIYPMPPQARYTLDMNEAYIVTFFGKPPITNVGFWSLTMYDDDNHFVTNPRKVYALGDRSSLKYPDGKPVYRGGNAAIDKPFKILIQPYDQQPPKNWTANWLPCPTGGAPWHVLMRIYGPDLGPAEDGSYEYPVFTKVDALRAN